MEKVDKNESCSLRKKCIHRFEITKNNPKGGELGGRKR